MRPCEGDQIQSLSSPFPTSSMQLKAFAEPAGECLLPLRTRTAKCHSMLLFLSNPCTLHVLNVVTILQLFEIIFAELGRPPETERRPRSNQKNSNCRGS